MTKQGFGKLASLKEAREVINRIIKEIDDEQVKIEAACGRVLAQDFMAKIDIPHFTRAAMDGFAVMAEDTFGSSNTNPKELKIIDSITAGSISQKHLSSGTCIEVTTGAPLPEKANAVLMVEYTEKEKDKLICYKSVAPGENIIDIGSDVKKGTLLAPKGTFINPRITGVLASQGITEVKVKRKPIVAVLSTGSEIIPPGQQLKVGKIYNVNTRTLIDALKEQNCEVVDLGIVEDDKELLKSAILESLKQADFILVSGGSSLGTEDIMVETIKELGELLVHGVAIRPGKPTVIGKVNEKLVLGLPGYPTSALSNFYILVIPIIEKMQGIAKQENFLYAKLSRKVVSTIGRYHFLPVKIKIENEEKIAVPIMKGSSAITTLSEADGFVEIDENTEVLQKGDTVKIRLF